jgi:hypothetical protein
MSTSRYVGYVRRHQVVEVHAQLYDSVEAVQRSMGLTPTTERWVITVDNDTSELLRAVTWSGEAEFVIVRVREGEKTY